MPAYELTQCVVCNHAEATEVASQDDVRREIEVLWEFYGRRLHSETPVSHLRDRVAFTEEPPLRLVACDTCGLVYRNPAERARDVSRTYARECADASVHHALRDAQYAAYRDRAKRLLRRAGPGSVLEVGSYVGAFLSAARSAGFSPEGVDINPDTNRLTRALGFTVHDGDFACVPVDRTFDAVAIWNTFDQLADPLGAIHRAWSLLRPGGVLAIRVPNGAYYRKRRTGAVAGSGRARAALAYNNLLTFPYRWGFTPSALESLVRELGFDVLALDGDVLPAVSDAWLRRWARAESRLVGLRERIAGRGDATRSPWFELYAARPN